MESFDLLMHGFSVALSPQNLMLAFVGCLLGTLMGALPGLGPVNGVAILIPVTFTLGLPPVAALILLVSVYYGTMYGGRISSIMLNIPGDEPAVMTTLDGYPMAQQGRAAAALAISAVASFVGATAATIGLTLFAPVLVGFAIHFGPAEYFALFMLAFLTVGGVTGRNPAKTLLAATIGLAIGTVGLDPATGVERYTFGLFELYDGIDFIAALVGLFAISEFLVFLEERQDRQNQPRLLVGSLKGALKELPATWWTMARGSVIGFVSGVLPGAGASLGSFLSYVLERRWLGKRGRFGTGDPRGVAAPEAGNNAAAAGSLVPMLSLGIPGSGTTAILLALLLSLNITPGPLLFEREPDLVWGLIAALYIGNVMLLILNLPLVGLFTRVLGLPYWLLMPLVVMVSFVGVYSLNNNPFDLYLMVGFGVFGYLLRKLDISLVPVVLGLLLGNSMEFNLRRALSISGGEWGILGASGISIGLYALAGVMIAAGIAVALVRQRGEKTGGGFEGP